MGHSFAAGTVVTRSHPHVPTLLTPISRHSCSVAAQASADATTQQQKQARSKQQQQPRRQQQQQRRRVDGPFPPPLTNKPYVVRVAGRTSSVQGAAGAITKRLRTDVSWESWQCGGLCGMGVKGGGALGRLTAPL
jgi:hypothetical protein